MEGTVQRKYHFKIPKVLKKVFSGFVIGGVVGGVCGVASQLILSKLGVQEDSNFHWVSSLVTGSCSGLLFGFWNASGKKSSKLTYTLPIIGSIFSCCAEIGLKSVSPKNFVLNKYFATRRIQEIGVGIACSVLIMQLLKYSRHSEVEVEEPEPIGAEGLGYHFKDEPRQKIVRKKILEEDFHLLKVIGDGFYSTVYLVQKKANGKYYAMKKMSKKHIIKQKMVDKIFTERQLLSQIHHPFIIGLHYSFTSPTHLYLIFEFVNGGDLFYHFEQEKRFSEEKTRFYAAEIFLALAHIHSKNALYRDVKLENVLIGKDGHVKLVDLGLAKVLRNRNDLTQSFVGTSTYLAPEMIQKIGYSDTGDMDKVIGGYGVHVDWWAFGILVYLMLFGSHPYDKTGEGDAVEIMKIALNTELKFPTFVKVSKEAKDFVRRLLCLDTKKRLGSHDDSEIMNHPFFKGKVKWRKLMKKEIVPPFIPDLKSDNDVTYIDKEFLSIPVQERGINPKINSNVTKKQSQEWMGYSGVYDPDELAKEFSKIKKKVMK